MQATKKTGPMFVSRRAHTRYGYYEPLSLTVDNGVMRAAGINISASGISVQLRGLGLLKEKKNLKIHLHNYPEITGVVRWTRGREVGIQFTEDVAKHPEIGALVTRIANGEPAVPEPRR